MREQWQLIRISLDRLAEELHKTSLSEAKSVQLLFLQSEVNERLTFDPETLKELDRERAEQYRLQQADNLLEEWRAYRRAAGITAPERMEDLRDWVQKPKQ